MMLAQRPAPLRAPDTGEPAETARAAHHQQSLRAWGILAKRRHARLAQRQTYLCLKSADIGPVRTKRRGVPEQNVEARFHIAQPQALASHIANRRTDAARITNLNEQFVAGAPYVDIDCDSLYAAAQSV